MVEYSKFDPSLEHKYEKPIFVRVPFEREVRDGYEYVFGTLREELNGQETYEVHIETMLLELVKYDAERMIQDGNVAVFSVHKEDLYIDERTKTK